MLWRDTTFNRTTKARILVYTFLIPFLVYLALTLCVFNSAERAIGSY